MRFLSIPGKIIVGIVTSVIFVSDASAETLNLSCNTSQSSQSRRLTIDLGSGLVSDQGDGSGRPWAARVSANDISWDEVFDSRIGHIADHYVFDRGAGTLHRTDMTRGESGRETVNAVCQKAP